MGGFAVGTTSEAYAWTVWGGGNYDRNYVPDLGDFSNPTNDVSITNSSSISVDGSKSGSFSLTAWVNVADLTDSMTILHKNRVSTGDLEMIAFIGGGDGKLCFSIASFGVGPWQNLTSTNALSAGTWYHVAVVKSLDNIKLYINGVLDSEFTQTSDPASNNGDWTLGSWHYLDKDYFEGSMDEVSIWTKALTQAEITAMQNQAIDPDSTDLGAYYRFDHTSDGLYLRDYTGNGNSATLNQYDHRRVPSGSVVP